VVILAALFSLAVLFAVLVAVGSEDCSIGVYSLPAAAEKLFIEPVLILEGHTSAVKALSSSWSPYRQLLFSGGGRASLKVWSIAENGKSGKWVKKNSKNSNKKVMSLYLKNKN